MGGMQVESLRLKISRPARGQTSIGCIFVRKRAEPILEGKANEATLCVPAPFTKWVLAAGVYHKGDWNFRSPGRLYAAVGL